MTLHEPIYVAGHKGLVGSAIVRALHEAGHTNLLIQTKQQLDLTVQDDVMKWFGRERPQTVFLAAAKVGGIHANSEFPGDFARENLSIAINVTDACRVHGVKRLVFLGSACIYPKHADNPIQEESLLSGPLEPTNAPYAIAKIAGLTLVSAYRKQFGMPGVSLMPANLYGPGDNFHPTHSHVIPGLMRRFHEAKVHGSPEVAVWGTGRASREFLHVDDLAEACLMIATKDSATDLLNVGSGEEVEIGELARLIAKVVGYSGRILFDHSKPDGTPRRVLDSTKIRRLGWKPQKNLAQGLSDTYQWCLETGVFAPRESRTASFERAM